MTKANEMNQQTTSQTPEKRAWVAPALEELPRLTELTLFSAIQGGGKILDGSGSTVF